jgi:SAM-dependent methyltransferase
MERLTDFYENLKSKFPDIVGSEFLSETSVPGQIYNGIRHEDVERLSFEPGTFDFVISCDVLEHVFNYKAAIQSIFSVLKQGGSVLFTFPFNFDQESHEIRAEMVAGKRIDHLPPEYHGNPVDPEGGSFCWRYYGWEILEELRGTGFSDVSLFASWSPQFAFLGGPQIVISATK